MIRLQGVTVKQFKDVLQEMKSIYNYKDDETRLGGCFDPRFTNETPSRVEIYTTDKATGIDIVMSKGIERAVD